MHATWNNPLPLFWQVAPQPLMSSKKYPPLCMTATIRPNKGPWAQVHKTEARTSGLLMSQQIQSSSSSLEACSMFVSRLSPKMLSTSNYAKTEQQHIQYTLCVMNVPKLPPTNKLTVNISITLTVDSTKETSLAGLSPLENYAFDRASNLWLKRTQDCLNWTSKYLFLFSITPFVQFPNCL